MKSVVLFVAALLFGLLASQPAKACGLFPSAIVAAPIVVSPVVQTYQAPVVVAPVVTPAVVTPTVGSVAVVSPVVVPVVTPVFAVQTFHGYHAQNVVVQKQVVVGNGRGNVNVQRGLANVAVGGRGGGGNVNVQRGLLNLKLGR